MHVLTSHLNSRNLAVLLPLVNKIGVYMEVTLEQIHRLNGRIGCRVYSLDTQTGLLVAASVSPSYVKDHFIDDLIDLNGNLTNRAHMIARDILDDN